MWSLESCSLKLPDWEKRVERSSGLGSNSTGDEKDRLSRFREGSAGNECQGVKELIGETYVHPISTSDCRRDKLHQRLLQPTVTPENRN